MRGLVGAVLVASATLCAAGCKDPIPPGPDLVTCPCLCQTQSPLGNTFGCDNRLCETRPCPPGRVCTGMGRCDGTCVASTPVLTSQSTAPNLHVCVDATNPATAAQACAARCNSYGSTQSSALTCVSAVLTALGQQDLLPGRVSDDLASQVDPASADALVGLIIADCGTLLTDTLTGTCGLS